MTQTTVTGDVTATRRALARSASLSIQNVYDAIVELVTNADDRYQVLDQPGRIEIEVERRRGQPSILRVRDGADGMTHEDMSRKLARVGERVSGMETGAAVRGTNSRGAKDVSALGRVVFESIAVKDGRFHRFELSPSFKYSIEPPEEVTADIRDRIGIPSGSGTLVSIEVETQHSIPKHENLAQKLGALVQLRQVLGDPRRQVVLIDANSGVKTFLEAPKVDGVPCINESFEVEGYPGIKAKLRVFRAKRQLPGDQSRRFRTNGIVVASGRGAHESTYFEPALERDPHAQRFYGTLRCEGIDQLDREFDDRAEREEPQRPDNPRPVIDPSRRAGLTRDHPFFNALREEVLYRFRPLVVEERRLAEGKKARVESEATRRCLNKLEEVAAKFMADSAQDEITREATRKSAGSGFKKKGYMLSPPFAQLLVGHSRDYKFSVNRTVFPGLNEGDQIRVSVTPGELALSATSFMLKPDEEDSAILICKWKVTAVGPVRTTSVSVTAGEIETQGLVEVLASEADKYRDISDFRFRRSRYQMKINSKRRNIRVLAPITMFPDRQTLEVSIDHPNFTVFGETTMQPKPDLGISFCDLSVESGDREATAQVVVEANGHVTEATLQSFAPLGSNLVIKLEDIDLGDQRYRYVVSLRQACMKAA